MTAYLQVVGSAHDLSPTILLVTEKGRILFNCGEGTQRFCPEHKVKIWRNDHICLTKLDWEHLGGAPGMLLTACHHAQYPVVIHGPRGTTDLFHSMSSFFEPEYLPHISFADVHAHAKPITMEGCVIYPIIVNASAEALQRQEERQQHYTIADESMQGEESDDEASEEECCHYRPSSPKQAQPASASEEQHEQQSDHVCMDAAEVAQQSANFMPSEPTVQDPRSPQHTATTSSQASQGGDTNATSEAAIELDVTSPESSSGNASVICYVGHLPAPLGKFDPVKAKALGVKPGPDFKRLQQGETIELSNGTHVHPDDVIGPAPPGPVFVIVDCPSQDYIQGFIDNERLLQLCNFGDRKANVVVHMTPSPVFESDEYQSFARMFGKQATHLVVNQEYCKPASMFSCAAHNQSLLNTIDDAVFPQLYASATPHRPLPSFPGMVVAVGEPLVKFNVFPVHKMGIDLSESPTEVSSRRTEEALQQLPEFMEAVEQFKAEHREKFEHNLLPEAHRNGKVTFLGTASAIPSKFRTVSGLLVTVPQDDNTQPKYMLIDPGEGSFGQLFRLFGPELCDVLRNLVSIHVSHLHADHHLGLLRVLCARQRLVNAESLEPLLVVAPSPMLTWLRSYSCLAEPLTFRFQNISQLQSKSSAFASASASLARHGIVSQSSVRVIHCARAFGIIIEHTSGWKLVYSGDTRPCPALIAAGQQASLLIHEATFDDELAEDAVKKCHSTISEAIAVGEQMHVTYTVLTHFSQRYPKAPVFDDQRNQTVGFATDFMSIDYHNLHHVPAYSRLVNILFSQVVAKSEGDDGSSE